MRQCVRDALSALTEKFESFVDFFYCDVKGLVSIGDGFLADPPARIPAGLVFVPSDPAAIMSSWRAVKDAAGSCEAGGAHYASLPGNVVRATKESIQKVFLAKLDDNERYLRRYFPQFDIFPSDAQLALHLMAWAYGAAFSPRWPHLTAAVRKQDWATAAAQSKPSDAELAKQNKSFHDRVAAIQACFTNAANTTDPETLTYGV